MDERDHDVVKYLEKFDPKWRKTLPWIRFHEFSETLFDMHAEFLSGGKLDCTHYVYDAGIINGLLHAIVKMFSNI